MPFNTTRTVKTASGKEYPCELFLVNQQVGIAFVSITGLTWAGASELFGNAAEMARLEYSGQVIEGYTKLDYIMQEPYGLKAQLSIPR